MQEIVSICVITFNNEKYVIETLDSIKNQTYKDIELIISDDNSSDKTLDVIKKWLEKNQNRFINTTLIEFESNTGVTANCNRAVKIAKGQYIKIIGDDLLKKDYVEKCIDYFSKNSNVEVLCTEMDYFYPEDKFEFIQKDIDYHFFELTAEEQYIYILKKYLPRYPTPSVIYKKKVFDKVGYFDESIPLWEDGPMYFKLAKNKIKMHFINEPLVNYRLLPKSSSNNGTKRFQINVSKYTLKYICPNELKINPIKSVLRYFKHIVLLIKNILSTTKI